MEERKINPIFMMVILTVIAVVSFMVGLNHSANAASAANSEDKVQKKEPRVIYPKKTDLDFEGIQIEGQVQNPGEFYFQHRMEDKFDSLVKRRKNFHREMLRDVVLSK